MRRYLNVLICLAVIGVGVGGWGLWTAIDEHLDRATSREEITKACDGLVDPDQVLGLNGGTARAEPGSEPNVELEVMPDHVHFLVEVDPQFGVHRLVKAVKGRSSRVLREEFPALKSRLPTLWTNSYFVATVGGAPLEVVKKYVENQKNV